jgi:uncharacterized membrane protein
MFEWLFQYPRIVFERGSFTFLTGWPVWLLIVVCVAASAILAWRLFSPDRPEDLPKEHRKLSFAGRLRLRLTPRTVGIWLLQSAFAALVFFLLWRPGLEVSALRSQQNVIAVLVDDSASMLENDGGSSRLSIAKQVLNDEILPGLRDRFAVRLYSVSGRSATVGSLDEITGTGIASQLGDSLAQFARDTSNLPVGGVLLVSDGADNRGAIDPEVLSTIRARRVPIHTLGIGRTNMESDVEIEDVSVAPRTFANAKLGAAVRVRQGGFAGRPVRLTLKLDGKVVANREITLPPDGRPLIEEITFPAGEAAAKVLEAGIEPVEGERNLGNNFRRQLINVDPDKPRILYVEGEPRWEMKFIRRAMEEEQTIELVSMLRTTQNKIYRQGVRDGRELEDGFPLRAKDLFKYSGLIIGTVEANWFTPAQLNLIKRFVDERGGGLLMLGGRSGLGDGGYASSPLESLLPVALPAGSNSFVRNPAKVSLTARGEESLITRLVDDQAENRKLWGELPPLADVQRVGDPRPGASVLLETGSGDGRRPLLATQRYGHGRTAVFATGGSWRWRMLRDHKDESHHIFWRQLLRWLVTDAPRQVTSELSEQILFDRGGLSITAYVRDEEWSPLNDATVVAHISHPNGTTSEERMEPVSGQSGEYRLVTTASTPGTYITEIIAKRGSEEVGRDSVTFRREDGVAEDFSRQQNRPLLQALSQRTGGKYYTPDDASSIASDMTYSEAGLTMRETRDLWSMPTFFLALLLLKSAEWLLRRRWGAL